MLWVEYEHEYEHEYANRGGIKCLSLCDGPGLQPLMRGGAGPGVPLRFTPGWDGVGRWPVGGSSALMIQVNITLLFLVVVLVLVLVLVLEEGHYAR